MSDDAEGSGKPGLLRQEGVHRVTISPGSTSALSAASSLNTTRLRPAVGPRTASPTTTGVQQAIPGGTVGHPHSASPDRAPAPWRLDAARVAAHRWSAQGDTALQEQQARHGNDLQRRMAALAELNLKTSRRVTDLERDLLGQPAQEAAPADDSSS